MINFWQEVRGAVPSIPYGKFDKDAKLNFSFDVTEWAASAGLGLTLDTVEVIADTRLEVTRKNVLANEFRCRIERSAVPARVGDRIPFTLRFVLSDGQQDDRSFELVLADK